jgi:hypothetical protein
MFPMFPVLPMMGTMSPIIMNHDIVNRIKSCFTSHPVATHVPKGGCMVLDDEQWTVYKKNLAQKAKERKNKKIVEKSVKRLVRNQRDTTFEPIDYSGKGIARICADRFSIVTFSCIDDVPGDNVYQNAVVACLRGETSTFDGYFWIPK